ncbi:GGDEF domain-containing protein [Alishewanella longhuensis]|uniref:diguanylate cyclase n=2 Tax=Alishewanella longhuensis TaxID=1091037 RepID=A0ABQ3L7X0_9ALTE|nr:GGDEF domain-containing protein [Alishewanella longhuensis]
MAVKVIAPRILGYPLLLMALLVLAASLIPCYSQANQLTAQQSLLKPYDQLHRRVWNTEHGLPQISVVAITQDQQGYMWLATEGGLAQFDGNQFKVFNAANSALFTNPLLRSLFATTAGDLLIGSSDKLILRREQVFSELTLNGDSVGSVEAIVENNAAQVFIAAQQLLLWQNDQLSVLPIPTRPVTSLLADGEKLWIGGPGYLALWQQHLPAAQQYQIIYDQQQPGWLIKAIQVNQQGLLLATAQGLWQYHSNSGEVSLAEPKIQDEVLLLFKQQSTTWIATYHELFQLQDGKLLARFDISAAQGVPWLVSAYQSKDGYLWFGSKTHGLMRLRADATANHAVASGIPDPYVWALQATTDKLLVGYNGGLASFDGERFTTLLSGSELSHPVVYSLYRAYDGAIWAGTRRGLNRISADYTEITRYPSLDHIQINGVTQSADGTIWIGTFDGLYRLAANSQQPELMSALFEGGPARIRMVFTDSQDRLWLGTSAGAYVLEQGRLRQVTDPLLSNVYVSFITELADGRILLGTFQHGFAYEDGQGGWYKVLPQHGLPTADVLFLAETPQGVVVSNFNGVYRLQSQVLQQGEVVAQVIIDDSGAEAGVDGFRCCNGAGNSKGLVWQDKLYLPTLNGMVSIDLPALRQEIITPAAIIEQVVAAGQRLPNAPVLQLAAAQRDLVFSFTAPVYYRPKALIFRYRLKGYEQDWVEVNDRRQAFYTNLPAGKFQFQVQVRYQGEGDWSDVVEQPLLLKAHWYEQSWFYLLLVLLVLVMLYLFYWIWLKRLAHQQQQLELMVQERTQQLDAANQQLAALNQRLQQQSITDALTGLHNRHYLQQIVGPLLASVQRQDRALHCLLIDLDNFKQVNDLFGHQAGDAVLKQMALLLKQLVRQSDHLIRWGGEEFLLILESNEPPGIFLDRLLQAMQDEPWLISEHQLAKISCSIGVVSYPFAKNSDWSWTQALALADKALYQVKAAGKTGWLQLSPNDAADDPLYWLQQNVLQMLRSGAFSFDASPRIKRTVQQGLAVLQH